jgi:predicted patatin/cPLA2 family phospholipase
MKKKKLILILSGGGAKCSFQVGAFNRLVQEGIQFGDSHLDVKIPARVFDTSVGGINGVMIGMGKFQELIKFWNQIAGNPQEIFTSKFTNNQDLQKAVLASASFPLICSPVENIQTKDFELSHLIDGCVRDTTPLRDAVEYINCDKDDAEYHFLVISCHRPSVDVLKKKPNLFTIAERAIYDIMLNEMQSSDLSEFLRINDLVQQADKKGCELFSKSGRKLKSFKVQIIRPDRKLKGGLDFSRTAVMDSFAHGYEVAKKATR